MSGFWLLKHRHCLKDVMSIWHCNLIRRLKCSPTPHACRQGLFLSWSLRFLPPGQNLSRMSCHCGKQTYGGAKCFFNVDLLAHNVFFQKVYGLRTCPSPSWINSSQVCSRLHPCLFRLRRARLSESVLLLRLSTHTRGYLYTSTSFTTHIISKAPLYKSFRFQSACVLVLHLRGWYILVLTLCLNEVWLWNQVFLRSN